MTNYQEAIDWIHSREKFKVKPGLKRMVWMMERLGHPERSLHAIHIAGTNGKGSTVSFLRNLLQAQGYKVGAFTSPYIIRFNERITINGEPIADKQLADLVEEIKPLVVELKETLLGEPTEFEIITVIAMLYFSKQELDYVLFETGLGGRYDSTNIIQPILSIITNIGLDHINILGTTFEEIANEKAGIIKQGIPVICGAKQLEAIRVIKTKAQSMGAPLSLLEGDFHSEHLRSDREGEYFVFHNQHYESGILFTGMKGKHQVENASLALQALEVLVERGEPFIREVYREGINATDWPARFETIRKHPLTIIDGAHNEEGTRALVDTVKDHFKEGKIYLIYAALEDKPVENMLAQLGEVVDIAYLTTFDFPRALSASELLDLSPIQNSRAFQNYEEAIEEASELVGDNDLLLITGSLYFISAIRKYFELV